MATMRTSALRDLFPLNSSDDVVRLFCQHLQTAADEPDLTLLSIVTGLIENTLTSRCAVGASPSAPSAGSYHPQSPPNNNNNNSKASSTPAAANIDGPDETAEQQLPQQQQVPSDSDAGTSGSGNHQLSTFPIVRLTDVTALYDKFEAILSLVEPIPSVQAAAGSSSSSSSSSHTTSTRRQQQQQTQAASPRKYATRELIKRVSDIVWNSLIRSTYKDRAHLQSLYSYLAAGKLDCFGMALAVVAGCQRLGYADVRLAISEDHAWVVFGPSGTDTIEVTWHGKGTEDKRGQPATTGYQSRSWLYLAGHPVVCTTRAMEVAAIVSAINPSMSVTSTCAEVADLQQRLLWILYDRRHLQRYPMALGCLGELEEVAPTGGDGRPGCERLYALAVRSARVHYRNHHVYPYTFQGVYYYRQNQYKDAFSAWANAGDVIRLYNYSRDDEEIYKEFLDIANEHIPWIMKTESSGHSAHSVLRDPQCFANLLRFYDGICQWEEGSPTPILHIGWAKPLVTTISRFDGDIRSQVIIELARDSDDVHKCAEAVSLAERARPLEDDDDDVGCGAADEAAAAAVDTETNNNNNNNNNGVAGAPKNGCEITTTTTASNAASAKAAATKAAAAAPLISSLEALTAACGEKILNPDFLLQGGGQPFAEQQQQKNSDDEADDDAEEKMQQEANTVGGVGSKDDATAGEHETTIGDNDHITAGETAENAGFSDASDASPSSLVAAAKSPTTTSTTIIGGGPPTPPTPTPPPSAAPMIHSPPAIMVPTYTPPLDIVEPVRPTITLYSRKMKGIRDLLVAEKLNTHAISLQVTAQSQVQVAGKKGRSLASSVSYAAKRTRRQ